MQETPDLTPADGVVISADEKVADSFKSESASKDAADVDKPSDNVDIPIGQDSGDEKTNENKTCDSDKAVCGAMSDSDDIDPIEKTDQTVNGTKTDEDGSAVETEQPLKKEAAEEGKQEEDDQKMASNPSVEDKKLPNGSNAEDEDKNDGIEIIDDDDDDDDVMEIDAADPVETVNVPAKKSTQVQENSPRPNVVTIDDFKTLHKLANSSRSRQLDKARKRFNDLATSSAFLKNRLSGGKNGSATLCTGSGVTITPAVRPSQSNSSFNAASISPSLTVSPALTGAGRSSLNNSSDSMMSKATLSAKKLLVGAAAAAAAAATTTASDVSGDLGSCTENGNENEKVEEDKNLTDDTCVVEAPSFIVPYVYERPPEKSFDSFSDEIRHIMADEKRKKKKEEKEEKADKKEKDEKKEDGDGDEEVGKESASKSEAREEDRDKKEEVMDEKEEEESATTEVVDLDDEDDTSDIEPKRKREPAADYFESTLGRFLVDLGSSLVQEFVQTDLLSAQVKKSQKDKSATVMHSIVSLKKNLEQGKQHNEPFHLREIKCKMCSFRTESELTMQHHLESPHMRNFVYRCNFCPLEVRDPHDILTHALLKHGVRARLERPPAMHQCTFCLFEDNMKGKVTRHIKSCEKLFNTNRNLAPPFEWDPPAKIPKSSAIIPAPGAIPVATLTSHQNQQSVAANSVAAMANQMSPQFMAQYQQQLQQQQMNNLFGSGRSSASSASAAANASHALTGSTGGNMLSQAQQKQILQLQRMQQRTNSAAAGGGSSTNAAQLQQYQQQLASCVASLISSAGGNQAAGGKANSPNIMASTLSRLAAAANNTGNNASSNASKFSRQANSKAKGSWNGSNSSSEVEQQNLSRLLLASKLSKMSNVSASQRALLAKHLADQQVNSSSVLSSLSNNSSVTIQSVNGSRKGSSQSLASAFNNGSGNSGSNKPSISITPLPSGNSSSESGNSGLRGAMSGRTVGTKAPGKTANHVPGANGFVICEVCDGYVKDLEQLRHHMLFMHKVKIHPKMIHNRPPLNCQKCQYRFFTDQGLERHLLGSHGLVTASMQEMANTGKDAGRCPVCGKAFPSKLLSHVTSDHQISLKPAHLSYKCTVCTATFGQYKLFENHVYQAHSSGGGSLKRQAAGAAGSGGSSSSANNQNSHSAPPAKTSKLGLKSSSTGGEKKVATSAADNDDVIELDSDDDAGVKANRSAKQTKSNGVCQVST